MWHIENYFQEDNLLSNMKIAAYFILLYEHFEDMVIDTVRKFYTSPCILDGKLFSDIDDAYINLLKEKVEKGEEVGSIPAAFVLAEAEQARAVYQKEVLGEKKENNARKFRGSLNWLQKHEGITEAENAKILKIRDRRNEITHGLLQKIGEGMTDEDVQMIGELLSLNQRIGAWRFQQIDMPIMEIELPDGADADDVMGNDDVLLTGIFRILFCGEGEQFKEVFDKELKNETPI